MLNTSGTRRFSELAQIATVGPAISYHFFSKALTALPAPIARPASHGTSLEIVRGCAASLSPKRPRQNSSLAPSRLARCRCPLPTALPANDTTRAEHVFGECRAVRGGAFKHHCYTSSKLCYRGGAISALCLQSDAARYALRHAETLPRYHNTTVTSLGLCNLPLPLPAPAN